MKTPWRKGLYRLIASTTISGEILDLGGSRKSGYHELIGGDHTFTVVNIDGNKDVDIAHNIEKPFPISNDKYDGVLLINVIEHIYDHKSLLKESARVLKKGGSIVIGVPFLVQVHPSPNDHWRYTDQTLNRLLADTGFTNIKVQPVGNGPFTISAQLLFNPLKISIFRWPVIALATVADKVLSIFKSRKELEATYPLGYFVIAQKA